MAGLAVSDFRATAHVSLDMIAHIQLESLSNVHHFALHVHACVWTRSVLVNYPSALPIPLRDTEQIRATVMQNGGI